MTSLENENKTPEITPSWVPGPFHIPLSASHLPINTQIAQMITTLEKTANYTQRINTLYYAMMNPSPTDLNIGRFSPTEPSTPSSVTNEREHQLLLKPQKMMEDIILTALHNISIDSKDASKNLNGLVKTLIRLFALVKMKDWETLSNFMLLTTLLPRDLQSTTDYTNAVDMVRALVDQRDLIIDTLPAALPCKEAIYQMVRDCPIDGEHYLNLHFDRCDASIANTWAT